MRGKVTQIGAVVLMLCMATKPVAAAQFVTSNRLDVNRGMAMCTNRAMGLAPVTLPTDIRVAELHALADGTASCRA